MRASTYPVALALAAAVIAIGAGRCRTSPAAGGVERDAAFAEAMRGSPVSAVRMLQRLIERTPNDSEAYAQLADVYRRQAWTHEARAYFTDEAGARRRGAPELGYLAAVFAAFDGDEAEASRQVAAARRHRGPSAAEAMTLAEALAALGRRDAARELLGEASSGNPALFEPQVRYAAALAEAGDTAQAQRVMQTALVRFPTEARVVGAAAELRFYVADLAGSEELTRRWLDITPRSAEARWNLTRIALRRGDYRRADSLVFLTSQTGR